MQSNRIGERERGREGERERGREGEKARGREGEWRRGGSDRIYRKPVGDAVSTTT